MPPKILKPLPFRCYACGQERRIRIDREVHLKTHHSKILDERSFEQRRRDLQKRRPPRG